MDYKVDGLDHNKTNGSADRSPITITLYDSKGEMGRLVLNKELHSPAWWNYNVPGSVKRRGELVAVEIASSSSSGLLIDDLIIKLNNQQVFQLDANDNKGWLIGNVGIKHWTEWIKAGKQSTSLPRKKWNIKEEREYKIAFHYSRAGDVMLKAAVYDPSSKLIQSASKGYQKTIAGWVEFKTIKTSRVIDKIKIYNEGENPYIIDQVEIMQNGIKISDYGLRGQNNSKLKGNFEYSIE